MLAKVFIYESEYISNKQYYNRRMSPPGLYYMFLKTFFLIYKDA
jgi:hypothetical protein